jgi:uncharacterized membrane protein YkvA (DUF1232 family)
MKRHRKESPRPPSRFPAEFSLRQGNARDVLRSLLDEATSPTDDLHGAVDAYIAAVRLRAEREEFVDLQLAEKLATLAHRLLDHLSDQSPNAHACLIQAAVRYFVLQEDAQSDLASVVGWDDDVEVFNAVARFVDRADLVVGTS